MYIQLLIYLLWSWNGWKETLMQYMISILYINRVVAAGGRLRINEG